MDDRSSRAIGNCDCASSSCGCLACLPCCASGVCYTLARDFERIETLAARLERDECCCEPCVVWILAPAYVANALTACYAKACWGVEHTNGADCSTHQHNLVRTVVHTLAAPCTFPALAVHGCYACIRNDRGGCTSCCCPCCFTPAVAHAPPSQQEMQDGDAQPSVGPPMVVGEDTRPEGSPI